MTIAASVLFTTLSKKILDKDDTQIEDELPKDESVFSKIKKLGIIPIIILVVAIGGDFLTNAAAMLTLLSGNLLASIMSILATLCALWALLRFFQIDRHAFTFFVTFPNKIIYIRFNYVVNFIVGLIL